MCFGRQKQLSSGGVAAGGGKGGGGEVVERYSFWVGLVCQWATQALSFRPAPPSDPQRARFGLGSPDSKSARSGANWGLGGAAG